MNNKIKYNTVIMLFAIFIFYACEKSTSGISVEEVWSMPVALHEMGSEMTKKMGAHEGHAGHQSGSNGVAYLTIQNKGSAPDRLLAVQTDVCAAAEIHRTSMENERMVMKKIESGVEIPAGASVTFKPRDFHIMLIGLKRSLVDGEEIALDLQFQHAGVVSVVSKVRPL